MCQFVYAEQFMGMVAYSYSHSDRNEKKIPLSKLSQMSNEVERENKMSDMVLSISGADIYSTVSQYSSCFSMRNREIYFEEEGYIYESYFLSGMPKSVRKNLEDLISKIID